MDEDDERAWSFPLLYIVQKKEPNSNLRQVDFSRIILCDRYMTYNTLITQFLRLV